MSTFVPGQGRHEQAVFGRGFHNGIVTVARRLMATGLLPKRDPSADARPSGASSDP